MRSWLFFALGSVTLVVHSGLGAIASDQQDASALFELLTLALFATGFVMLYGSDREQLRLIETRAERDTQTGLLNRETFREVANSRLRRSRRAPSALAIVDLDGFKAVNDSRGHPAGDQVLELVATAIRANLRTNDIAARYGGDEFLVFLSECGAETALRIMERIRAIVAGVTSISGQGVTASVGLSIAGSGDDVDDLIRIADEALLAVKQSGKDRLLMAGAAPRR